MTSEGGEFSDVEKNEIAEEIKKSVNNFKTTLEKGEKDGNLSYIKNFPMDVLLPFAALY